jgi:hypothetical protein
MLAGGFSTLDLNRGYWEAVQHPDDKKTAISTAQELLQFTAKPFYPCNAPETFERLIETVLRGLTYESCLAYLDDVIVIGRMLK